MRSSGVASRLVRWLRALPAALVLVFSAHPTATEPQPVRIVEVRHPNVTRTKLIRQLYEPVRLNSFRLVVT